jgi:hypothetical protein
MWLLAVSLSESISLIIGIFGVAGLVFTALKWRRDDTTAVLGQQDTIMKEMQGLNGELRESANRLRTHNAELEAQVALLTSELAEARSEHGNST